MNQLIEYLRKAKDKIVVKQEVLVEVYDPTYGLQDPVSREIEIVDFDALLDAIDKFSYEFKD